MRDTISNIAEEKLKRVLQQVDEETRHAMNKIWNRIRPGPDCPYITVAVSDMKQALCTGYFQRGEKAKETVLATVIPMRDKLKTEDYKVILKVVTETLRSDVYSKWAGSMVDVYRRKQAWPKKYENVHLDAEIALINAHGLNVSAQAVHDIEVAFKEIQLQRSAGSPSKLRYGMGLFGKWAYGTAAKWIFGILGSIIGVVCAGLIIALILDALGLKK